MASLPHQPSSSSSSSSAMTTTKSRRRYTREQLLSRLEALNAIIDQTPLPPTLPPSPPTSRPASPAPGSKRKADSSALHESSALPKRPRTSSVIDKRAGALADRQSLQPAHHSHHLQPPHSLQPPKPQAISTPQPSFPPRPEPEEGEVKEEATLAVQTPPIPTPPSASIDVPIRRPRRGKQSQEHMEALHKHYIDVGRMFKYSAEARHRSTVVPNQKGYRPLQPPPPKDSPYYKHGAVISRLEAIEGLCCFTYAMWSQEYLSNSFKNNNWNSISSFLFWVRGKWQSEGGSNDAEKAFIGLIAMVEGFIIGRRLARMNAVKMEMARFTTRLKNKIAQAAEASEKGLSMINGVRTSSTGTPMMLPSPASIGNPNSANSTPTHGEHGNTPNANAMVVQQVIQRTSRPQPSASVPGPMRPLHLSKDHVEVPPPVMDAMAAVSEPMGAWLAHNLQCMISDNGMAAQLSNNSETTLNFPVMMRCFPKTWNRMAHSTLLPTEEYEPDFEDDECELYWPGQANSGAGLAWVCLMGKSMVKEFGAQYGYRGIDGLHLKPPPDGTPPQTSASHNNSSSGRR